MVTCTHFWVCVYSSESSLRSDRKRRLDMPVGEGYQSSTTSSTSEMTMPIAPANKLGKSTAGSMSPHELSPHHSMSASLRSVSVYTYSTTHSCCRLHPFMLLLVDNAFFSHNNAVAMCTLHNNWYHFWCSHAELSSLSKTTPYSMRSFINEIN